MSFINIFDFFILLYILDIFQFLVGFQDLKTIGALEKVFNIERDINIYQLLYKKTRYYVYLIPNIFFAGFNFYFLIPNFLANIAKGS